MLNSILDAGITNKLIRIGARTSDERIKEYTIDKFENEAPKSSVNRSIGKQYAEMKKLEGEILEVMETIQAPQLEWHRIQNHLEILYSDHVMELEQPPFWIQALYDRQHEDEEENGEFITVERSKKGKQVAKDVAGTLYDFWKRGEDLRYIMPQRVPVQPLENRKRKGKGKNRAMDQIQTQPVQFAPIPPDVVEFFFNLGFQTIPPAPSTNRPVTILEQSSSVWSMSLIERQRLSSMWEDEIRTAAYEMNLSRYEELRTQYKDACKDYNDMRDEVRPLFVVARLLC